MSQSFPALAVNNGTRLPAGEAGMTRIDARIYTEERLCCEILFKGRIIKNDKRGKGFPSVQNLRTPYL
jgi:hypothetical protein